MHHKVFITGGTGYIGSRVIPLLRSRGHSVTALVRETSRRKLPSDCDAVIGDALNGESYRAHLSQFDTFIHLVGASHPGPAKARQFVEIDLKSAQEAIRVAHAARVEHFIYMSVAHPAPVMKAYLDVRSACESALRGTGMNATVLRPWYVLGPGHRWPIFLQPFYRLAELFPATRDGARRLGFVTLAEMGNALVFATENRATGTRIIEVPEIRSLSRRTR